MDEYDSYLDSLAGGRPLPLRDEILWDLLKKDCITNRMTSRNIKALEGHCTGYCMCVIINDRQFSFFPKSSGWRNRNSRLETQLETRERKRCQPCLQLSSNLKSWWESLAAWNQNYKDIYIAVKCRSLLVLEIQFDWLIILEKVWSSGLVEEGHKCRAKFRGFSCSSPSLRSMRKEIVLR
jgi:hypothetical protein